MASVIITLGQRSARGVRQIALTAFLYMLFYAFILLAATAIWYAFIWTVAENKLVQYLLASIAFLLLFVYLFTRKKSDDPYD